MTLSFHECRTPFDKIKHHFMIRLFNKLGKEGHSWAQWRPVIKSQEHTSYSMLEDWKFSLYEQNEAEVPIATTSVQHRTEGPTQRN
jgi:hypothetical protein